MRSADPELKENPVTTAEDLLDMNVVPIFIENGAISKGMVNSKHYPIASSALHHCVYTCGDCRETENRHLRDATWPQMAHAQLNKLLECLLYLCIASF